MKSLRAFIVLVLILTTSLTSGQGHKYIPFSDSAFIWRVVTYDLANSNEDNYQYFVNGDDTLINGQEFMSAHYSKSVQLSPNHFRAIRNDTLNKKVFIFPGPNDTLEGLLYDFSLKVGDTTKSTLKGGMRFYPGNRIVTSIDSIFLNDGWHHVWHFDNDSSVAPMIEGIGGVRGLFEYPIVFEYESILICAIKYGMPFYPTNTTICELATGIIENTALDATYQLYPNPVIDVLHIASRHGFSNNIKVRLYDLQGKEVQCSSFELDSAEITINVSELTKGLYFLNLAIGIDRVFGSKFIKE